MIEVKRITSDGIVVIIDGKTCIEDFKVLVNRACGLWADAPAEIKKFADEITNSDWHSGPLQDYKTQDTSPRAILDKRRVKFNIFRGEIELPCLNCGKKYEEHLENNQHCPKEITEKEQKEQSNGT